MRLSFILPAIAAATLTSASASGMYRCGNAFQDRPCEAGVQQQVITPGRQGGGAAPVPARAAPAAPAAPPMPELSRVSPDAATTCRRMGERSEAIAMKRDAGATRQQQLAGADPETAQVVHMVYVQNKLSVPQVRAMVEMMCLGDEQVKAQTQAALRAAQEAQRRGLPPEQQRLAAEKAAGLHDPCTSLREGIATADHLLRGGGEPKYMAAMQEHRARLHAERRKLNCR